MQARGRIDLVMAGILVLAGALLLTNLDNGLLWQDEAETALLARNTLRFGYPRAFDGRHYLDVAGHGFGPGEAWIYSPWLPFYLLAGFFRAAGESTWIARLPFALFGWAAVFLTWRLVRRLTDDVRIHRLSVALLACSVPFMLHMRQCRYYAMATALLTGACLSYIAFLKRPSFRWIAALAVSLILLFHTNFGTFVPAFAAVFAHQAVGGTRQTSRRFLWGMGAVVLGAFPWALYFYRPAFIGALSLERMYRHLEYYIRITNKYLVPLALMAATSLGLALWRWRTQRRRVAASPSLDPSVRAFLLLMVALQVAFLLLPDQRHMRYLIPVLPILAIAEAWWLVSLFHTSRLRPVGWALAALALVTNVLQSVQPAIPLMDFAEELTHRYVGPMEGVVGYLRAHGKPGEVVKIPYDDRTLIFYTDLTVARPSEFLRESYPEWVVIRRGWIPAPFFQGAYFRRLEQTYERIELDAPDAFWQNREDPGLHHFRRAWWPPPVLMFHKRGATYG